MITAYAVAMMLVELAGLGLVLRGRIFPSFRRAFIDGEPLTFASTRAQRLRIGQTYAIVAIANAVAWCLFGWIRELLSPAVPAAVSWLEVVLPMAVIAATALRSAQLAVRSFDREERP